jgi:hypothetical protein
MELGVKNVASKRSKGTLQKSKSGLSKREK